MWIFIFKTRSYAVSDFSVMYMIWCQDDKHATMQIDLAPTPTDLCGIKDINAQSIWHKYFFLAQVLLNFFTSQSINSWLKLSMHQERICLLCALVVSEAMTANAECVLKSYSTVECKMLSKPKDEDCLVKEHTVWRKWSWSTLAFLSRTRDILWAWV